MASRDPVHRFMELAVRRNGHARADTEKASRESQEGLDVSPARESTSS